MNHIAGFFGQYRFLSNFHPSLIVFEGIAYPTVEHAFQAAKTLDTTQRAAISSLATPGLAKKAGRRVTLRSDWEQVKIQIMLELNRLKYADASLAALLLATSDSLLEEANTWGDQFWGTVKGVGQNNLGIILMQVRSELRLVNSQSSLDADIIAEYCKDNDICNQRASGCSWCTDENLLDYAKQQFDNGVHLVEGYPLNLRKLLNLRFKNTKE